MFNSSITINAARIYNNKNIDNDIYKKIVSQFNIIPEIIKKDFDRYKEEGLYKLTKSNNDDLIDYFSKYLNCLNNDEIEQLKTKVGISNYDFIEYNFKINTESYLRLNCKNIYKKED